ncbi:MAG: hypothetical protein WAW10_09630 [Gallionella sp.]
MGAVFGISSKCTLSGRFDELGGKLTPNYRMKYQIFIDNADSLDGTANLVMVIGQMRVSKNQADRLNAGRIADTRERLTSK